MKEAKRLGMPILVMAVSTFLFYVIHTYFHSDFAGTLITILFDGSLFLLGVTLNGKKRSHSVYRKVIGLVMSIVLIFIQLGSVSLPFVETLNAFFALNPYLLSMLFIYFGFLFMD